MKERVGRLEVSEGGQCVALQDLRLEDFPNSAGLCSKDSYTPEFDFD